MDNVGLKRGYLEIMDYREDYAKIYEKEKEELLKIYKDRISTIDHVGSTSIKNIKSKPIIDILIQTDDLEDFKKFTELDVEGDIYTVKKEPTMGGDYLIRKEEDGKVKAFIHVYKTGDMNGITSIMFRDYMNSHEDEKKRYEALKIELYEKYKEDRKQYTYGKDKYIKEIINKALEENRSFWGGNMKKPIIGIIGKVQPQYGEDLWHRIDEVDEIRYLIVKNGGTAIMLLPTEETLKFNDNDIKDDTVLKEEELNELYRQIDLCDGFILQGGLYSSNYEIEMAKRIIELDKPLIGICAGFNNILRAIGTDVVKDKTKSHDIYDINYRHNVSIIKGTKLYELIKKDEYNVNSIHSMIAPKEMVEGYAKISSISYDGLVESFELNDKKFVIGIKWHPELMLEDEFTTNLFKELIKKCIEKEN